MMPNGCAACSNEKAKAWMQPNAIASEASTMCPFFSPSRPVSFSAHPVAISTPQDKVAHIRT